MLFSRVVVCIMVQALLLSQTAAIAQSSHEQGVSTGQSANAVVRGLINQPSAATVVPGYTTTPAESALAGRPALGADVGARLAACTGIPNDPSCLALRTAITSANTPRQTISPSDPSVAAASRIARNPSLDIGDLSAYYSGCTTNNLTIAGRSETRTCSRYVASGAYTCSNSLSVSVGRSATCTPGDWFAQATSGTTAVAAQCLPNEPHTKQHFRVTSNGNPLAFFDVDMTQMELSPRKVAVIDSSRVGGIQTETAVFVADRSCTGDTCSLTAMVARNPSVSCIRFRDSPSTCTTVYPFIDVYSACPAGSQSGDNLLTICSPFPRDSVCTGERLNKATCYSPATGSPSIRARDTTRQYSATSWRSSSTRSVVGWAPNPVYGPIPQVHLTYTRPSTSSTSSDTWNDQCPGLSSSGRCTVATAPVCVDGPATKVIDGISVTRDCWEYQSTITCRDTHTADQCAPLISAGCTPLSSTCSRSNPVTGLCEAYQDQYACSVPSETVTQASNCPSNVFCFQGSCFNTAYTHDTDFARSMSMLEAAREAGVYLDTDRMTVFNGEPRFCRDRLLKNCCSANGSGTGMSNQSMFGVGSRLVFDALMSSRNFDYVRQGLLAFLTSNTSWTASAGAGAYGITVEFFAGDAVVTTTGDILFSSALTESTGMVISFDPWSLALAVVVTVIMSAMECNSEEAVTALSEGAGLCHSVGTRCTSCIRLLGSCVSCIEDTTGKCCFNSLLARLINQQGRAQVGKGWGSAEHPDCSGFTIAQLQSLDFARMNLSEFYASIVSKAPNVPSIQNNNASKLTTCYFGQGKC